MSEGTENTVQQPGTPVLLQPDNYNKKYEALFVEINTRQIKLPMFQREFVWEREQSAKLIDSILKGFPLGTFIFWKTKEDLRSYKEVGNHKLPETPKGDYAQYVLDGQQRITSLYAMQMNRKELQALSRMRLSEAQALSRLGLADGAYYLAGYAVECALKACIAKRTQRHEFPDKKRVNSSHTHDLKELIGVADLEGLRLAAAKADEQFRLNWDNVQSWSEQSRYSRHSAESAQELIEAIGNKKHGVIKWVMRYW